MLFDALYGPSAYLMTPHFSPQVGEKKVKGQGLNV